MRYHLTQVEWLSSKRQDNKCGQECGEDTLVHCRWEWKMPQQLWKTVWGTTTWSSNSTSGYTHTPSRMNSLFLRRYPHCHVHCIIIYNIQDMETTCVHQWTNGLRKRGVYRHTDTQWNTIQLQKRRKSCHLQQHG